MIQGAKYCQAINIGVLVSFSYLYQKRFIVKEKWMVVVLLSYPSVHIL
jgi:hypothetical protein